MIEDRKEMLLSYIKANVVPILIDFEDDLLNDAVVLRADIGTDELNGHYKGKKFSPPKWFNDIVNLKDKRILVIDKIDTISKEEQLKFCELLEYKKISTFELPINCVIIITANEINKDKINEEIFSLVARI